MSLPTCLSHVIAFLTGPLHPSQSPSLIKSLQSILSTTLPTIFNTADPNLRLTLALSTSSLPPRPIYAACVAAGFHWADWIVLLGAKDFNLVIERSLVAAVYFDPEMRSVVVWAEHAPLLSAPALPFDEPQIPISKLQQQSGRHSALLATVSSARARALTRTRTLAQLILESDHEDEEADEMFAMINKTTAVSPTKFAIDIPRSPMRMDMHESPDSSRPSSRSSTFSAFSFNDNDADSVTSASSSVVSLHFPSSTKPTSDVKTPTTAAPFTTVPFNARASAFISRAPSPPVQVFVDSSKKNVTKYLYQGGVSTVLTGGVMLGGGAKQPAAKLNEDAKPWEPAPAVPKYRAPIGGKKNAGVAATASSWRRAPIIAN